MRFEPAKGAPVQLKDEPVTSPIDLKDDGGAGDELTIGDVRLVVHVSGERLELRVRDPNGPLAKGFLGFTWFPIDLQYRVVGRFIRDAEPKPMKVLNTFGDVDEYKTEGVVEFTLQRTDAAAAPVHDAAEALLLRVPRRVERPRDVRDRALPLCGSAGRRHDACSDFNQAYNPPCAFNPYTTCPIPLRENRLPVKILAGEKAYPVHVPLGPPKSGGRP